MKNITLFVLLLVLSLGSGAQTPYVNNDNTYFRIVGTRNGDSIEVDGKKYGMYQCFDGKKQVKWASKKQVVYLLPCSGDGSVIIKGSEGLVPGWQSQMKPVMKCALDHKGYKTVEGYINCRAKSVTDSVLFLVGKDTLNLGIEADTNSVYSFLYRGKDVVVKPINGYVQLLSSCFENYDSGNCVVINLSVKRRNEYDSMNMGEYVIALAF